MRCLSLSILAVSVAFAQSAIVDSHTGCLLGGWDGKQWTAKPNFEAKRSYRVFGPESVEPLELLGEAPKPIEGPCGNALEVSFDKELPEGSIAVTGAGKQFTVEAIPLNSRTYISAFRALLDAHGVRSAVHIGQLLRVDLDGDGKQEVLASLYSVSDDSSTSHPGDYSAIVMRHLDAKDRLTTQVIAFEKHPRRGRVTHMTIGPLVDLNGDGKAEVVIRGEYAKGKFSHVYEMKNGKLVRVLECTCGE